MTMSPPLRKLVLAAHITTSVGWVGALMEYLVLDIAAVFSQDAPTVVAAFLAMELTATYAIVPLAAASLLVGIAAALGTSWGLFRHYWVLLKLFFTIFATAVLLLETRTIRSLADLAASGTDPRDLPGTLLHSGLGLLVLLVVITLAVYKPRGVTRYGWRKQALHSHP